MNIRTPVPHLQRPKAATSSLASSPALPPTELIDENELERRTGVSASTWAKRRTSGHTPPFMKIGKNVRYLWSDVLAWLDANTKQRSTADLCADKRDRKVSPKKCRDAR